MIDWSEYFEDIMGVTKPGDALMEIDSNSLSNLSFQIFNAASEIICVENASFDVKSE